MLKCGQETDFVNAYSSVIIANKLNIISVQGSVACLSTVNYFNLTISNTTLSFFKMIPVDVSLIDYQLNINTMLSLISKNVTSFSYEVIKKFKKKWNLIIKFTRLFSFLYKIFNVFDELESYFVLRNYSYASSLPIFINETSNFFTLNCFLNKNLFLELSVIYSMLRNNASGPEIGLPGLRPAGGAISVPSR